MTKRNTLAGAALLAAVLAAAGLWATLGGESPLAPAETVAGAPAAPEAAPSATRPLAQPGMVTHIDPATGELVAAPASGERFDTGLEFNSSTKGLPVEPSPVPGGGMIMKLEGRFMSATVATIDSTGARLECVPLDHGAGGER